MNRFLCMCIPSKPDATPMSHLRPTYLEGRNAARMGACYFTSCPYAAGSQERSDWIEGFNGYRGISW